MITVALKTYAPCPTGKKYATEHALGLSLLCAGLHKSRGIDLSPEHIEQSIDSSAYGKPYLKDYPHIHFNISHCDGLVACAIADTPIGIDIEKIHPFRDSILRKVLTPSEQEFLNTFRENTDAYNEIFYRFWTLKESRIKESGMGLSMPLTDFSFELDLTREPVGIMCSQEGLCFHQRRIGRDCFMAVCCSKTIEGIEIRWV